MELRHGGKSSANFREENISSEPAQATDFGLLFVGYQGAPVH